MRDCGIRLKDLLGECLFCEFDLLGVQSRKRIEVRCYLKKRMIVRVICVQVG